MKTFSQFIAEANSHLEEGMTMKDFMDARKKRERGEKRKELSPTRRAGIHTPEKKPERDARRDAAYGETGHGGALRPKKVRKAKALGELGEEASDRARDEHQMRGGMAARKDYDRPPAKKLSNAELGIKPGKTWVQKQMEKKQQEKK